MNRRKEVIKHLQSFRDKEMDEETTAILIERIFTKDRQLKIFNKDDKFMEPQANCIMSNTGAALQNVFDLEDNRVVFVFF